MNFVYERNVSMRTRAWIGSPHEIAATITRLQRDFGGFEHASLQVNFNTMPVEPALASMRLFAREVMPHFRRGE